MTRNRANHITGGNPRDRDDIRALHSSMPEHCMKTSVQPGNVPSSTSFFYP
jgi:hypothetical protein